MYSQLLAEYVPRVANVTSRSLSDAGASVGDTLLPQTQRALSSTGSTVAATLAPLTARKLSDYGTVRAPIIDTFTRTTANGWGTSDSGDAWTRVTGVASEFSTDGAVAKIATTVTNSSRYMTIGPTLPPDLDVVARFALAALPVAQSTTVGLVARYQDTSNHYRAWINWTTAGAVQLRLEKNIGNVLTTLTTQPNVLTGYVAGTFVWVRFQVIGSTLRVRVWADGSSEPSTWTHSVTDTDLRVGGAAAVRLFHVTGNSSTPTLSVDDFTATALLSDSLVDVPRRALADTASSIADTLAVALLRLLADAASSLSDAVAPRAARSAADTASALSDSLVGVPRRALADAGSSIADTPSVALLRLLADIGGSLSEAIRPRATRSVGDTASAVADALTITQLIGRAFTDAGASLSELVVPTLGRARFLTDAIVIADSLLQHGSRAVIVVDAAAVLSESLGGSASPTSFRWPSRLELARPTRRVRLADPARTLVIVRPARELVKARPPAVRVIRPLVYRP